LATILGQQTRKTLDKKPKNDEFSKAL